VPPCSASLQAVEDVWNLDGLSRFPQPSERPSAAEGGAERDGGGLGEGEGGGGGGGGGGGEGSGGRATEAAATRRRRWWSVEGAREVRPFFWPPAALSFSQPFLIKL
jgi:hypothetical protein